MKLKTLKNFLPLITLCYVIELSSQTLIDSSRNAKFFWSVGKHKLGLSPKNTKIRFSIDDKQHNLIVEQANGQLKDVFFLDSLCDFEKIPINCSRVDTAVKKYPNTEVLDWGLSVKIYDYKSSKQTINKKELLIKWFGNLDSIISCKEVFLSNPHKRDLAILRKVRAWDSEIDSISKQLRYFETNKIQYRLDILINKGDYYLKVHSSNSLDIKELKYLCIASFKAHNKNWYFVLNDYDYDKLNFLEYYDFITE